MLFLSYQERLDVEVVAMGEPRITDVKGIGEFAAARLAEQGITTVRELVGATIAVIAAARGFGPSRAAAVHAAATEAWSNFETLGPKPAKPGSGETAKPERKEEGPSNAASQEQSSKKKNSGQKRKKPSGKAVTQAKEKAKAKKAKAKAEAEAEAEAKAKAK